MWYGINSVDAVQVICVYDMSSKDSLRQALELMKEGGRMGANVRISFVHAC